MSESLGALGSLFPSLGNYSSQLDVLGSNNNSLGGNTNNTSQFAWNIPTAKLGVDALSSLAGIYVGLEQLGLAKDSFKFNRDFANKNLANQTKTYNTNYKDQLLARANQQNQSIASANSIYEQNKL